MQLFSCALTQIVTQSVEFLLLAAFYCSPTDVNTSVVCMVAQSLFNLNVIGIYFTIISKCNLLFYVDIFLRSILIFHSLWVAVGGLVSV